jgi:hypothetical protein
MPTQITEGARLLRAHLLRTDQTVPDFCEKHGISRQIAQRVLNGKQKTVSIDFATDVATATNGEVPPAAWRQETLREASPHEVGRVFPSHRRARTQDPDASRPSHPAAA